MASARAVAPPRVVAIGDLRPLAERRVPRAVFDYLDGGAEGEITLRENCRAFETQLAGRGFSFVEILTMCPTGWFVPTAEGPGYLDRVLRPVHATGELRNGDRCVTTDQLLAEARARTD